MGYLEDMVGKMGEVIFPSTEAGLTAHVKEYKDEVGNICKVAIRIIPTVAKLGGPTAAIVAGLSSSTVQTAQAIYNWLTTPEVQKSSLTPKDEGSKLAAESAAVLAETAKRLVLEGSGGGKGVSSGKAARILLEESRGHIQKGVKRAATERIATEVAKEGVRRLAKASPQVVVEIGGRVAGSANLVMTAKDFIDKARDLKRAVGDFQNTRRVNQAAKAAIELIEEEEREKAASPVKTKKKKKRTISATKAKQEILKHKKSVIQTRKQSR